MDPNIVLGGLWENIGFGEPVHYLGSNSTSMK